MIYYKFLNDKKGDLSQLWIAAQSPNKVSKRVILDISITECSKVIGGEESTLPLRMKALLLLGLSRILQKKAQLLVADCLRIQNAIGDVMCLTSNDLPNDLLSANDHQITLSHTAAPKTALDVNLSFDQGDMVDRWIESNFVQEQIGVDSLTGSHSTSMNETVRGLDMETDMLQKYTQQTIVDDLLPAESSLPLLSQSMEIETRRGEANTGLSLLNEADSLDMLDGGMEMDSLSDMRTQQTGATLLKPFEKTTVRSTHKRLSVPLDKSLELPLSGVILSRKQLRELLQTACSKRQCMNHREMILADINQVTSSGYSPSLEAMLASPLHMTPRTAPETRQSNISDFDDFGGGMEMDWDNDEGNITLSSIPNEEEEEGVNNNPTESQPAANTLTQKDSITSQAIREVEYTEFMTDIKQQFDEELLVNGKKELSWNSYTASNQRHEGARNFYNLLLAATNQELEVSQQQPFCDISVSLFA